VNKILLITTKIFGAAAPQPKEQKPSSRKDAEAQRHGEQRFFSVSTVAL
jgi:hypothetical protein